MAKKRFDTTRSGRLIKAVEAGQTQPAHVFRASRDSRNSGAAEIAQTRQRAIKYPNKSSALRQYVAETQREARPAPAIRLRVAPPQALGPADVIRTVRPDSGRPAVRQGSALAARTGVQQEKRLPVKAVSALGEIVRRERRLIGLSQADLAAIAGTGRRFISELEAGKPTLEFERLLKVCHALRIRLFAAIQSND